jgi:hypothetical protein
MSRIVLCIICVSVPNVSSELNADSIASLLFYDIGDVYPKRLQHISVAIKTVFYMKSTNQLKRCNIENKHTNNKSVRYNRAT